MSVSCCTPDDTTTLVAPRARRVALAGNPNAGKTTVFNLLTGMHQRVGNYPGVTVEKKTGRMVGEETVEVIDLPGTYSLNPKSLDEQIAYDVLAGHMDSETAPDLVVCVVDATNLERNLYLATQIMDLGLPTVVVLNMMDAVAEAGLEIDIDALAEALGTPVVPMAAAQKEGVADLRAVLTSPVPSAPPRRWALSSAVAARVEALDAVLAEAHPRMPAARRFSESLRALTNDRVLAYWEQAGPAFHTAVLEARRVLQERRVPYEQAEIMGRYGWLRPLAARVVTRRQEATARTLSDRLDAVLTHRVAGPISFLLILLLIFQAIFTWATPAMDLIEAGVLGLGTLVRDVLPAGVVTDLLVDGVIAGVGNVLVFLPQILLLFFFLGLMENTGYMARTAFIMDRVMRRVGLTGGSVVPMISSFACAIPGIMAARTMENQRDRIVTIMVAPLMSCSARLPVYTLFIAAFIPATTILGIVSYQGLAMLSLYLLGTVMAFVAAGVLKKFVIKGEQSFFMMELPPYRPPQLKLVLWRMYERARIFVMSAGRVILFFSVVLWFLASYPKVEPSPALQAERAALTARMEALPATPVADEAPRRAALEAELKALADAEAAYQTRHSFIGWFGRTLEPVMRPLGFDWKLTAGIISAFAAREVIISTLGTIYSVGEADENSAALRDQLRTDRDPETGRLVYTPLVAMSLMVFFVLALQCMSTLAIARRELNSWFWPAVMWTYMTGLAYLSALLVYQGGQALGLG